MATISYWRCFVLVLAIIPVISVTRWIVGLQQFSCHTRDDDSVTAISELWSIAQNMSAEEIFRYLHWTNSTSCLFAVDFGFFIRNGEGLAAPDGHKAICLDLPVSPVYNSCIVYSFGINNQWSFDKAMSDFRCKVYSFDPSMGEEDHDESQYIHFYNLGLAGKNGRHPSNGWKMETASSIYQKLLPYHGSVAIDIFKMDIEFSEWEVIPEMMKSGFLANHVKQLAVEIHFDPNDSLATFRNHVHILQKLESASPSDAGQFIRFSSRPNPWLKRELSILHGKEDYIGLELAWYNSRYFRA